MQDFLTLGIGSYDCNHCHKSYLIHDRYPDFLDGQVNFYPGEVPEANMKKLLQDIDSMGKYSFEPS